MQPAVATFVGDIAVQIEVQSLIRNGRVVERLMAPHSKFSLAVES